MMKEMQAHTVIKHGIYPTEATIEPGKEIIVGEFVDVEKPEYSDMIHALSKKYGDE